MIALLRVLAMFGVICALPFVLIGVAGLAIFWLIGVWATK